MLRRGAYSAQIGPPVGNTGVVLRDLSGGVIMQYGSQRPSVILPSGAGASLQGTVADTTRSVLAVSSQSDGGITTVFGPNGDYMTRAVIEPPAEREDLTRRGGHYFLPTREVMPRQQPDYTFAPVDEADVQHRYDQDNDEWDNAYNEAMERGEAVPFGRVVRNDSLAQRYRQVRKQDPCPLTAVFRRLTIDADTKEIIQDLYKADVDEDYMWRQLLPGGPRNIETRYYYYLGNESAPLLDLVKKKESAVDLRVPQMPGADEVARHMADHGRFAAWCQDCIAGRGRGQAHFSLKHKPDDATEYEGDYTFYSEEGFQISREERQRAQATITLTHKATGATCTSVVVRKGVWPYAVSLLSSFIINNSHKEVRLRGDGEPALQTLLNAVADQLRSQGISVQVPEATATASHQSIGSAERHHGTSVDQGTSR